MAGKHRRTRKTTIFRTGLTGIGVKFGSDFLKSLGAHNISNFPNLIDKEYVLERDKDSLEDSSKWVVSLLKVLEKVFWEDLGE